jgi:HD superfamily phosphodiesterase
MEKAKIESIFKDELSLITIDNLQKLVVDVMINLNDDFFNIPTSSTGKYHPIYCNKKHGLLLHTKLVVAYAIQMIEAYYGNDKDINFHTSIIISACLLHDIGKKARYQNYKEEYENHPLIASELFVTTYNNQTLFYTIDNDIIMMIVNCINFHGGLWTPEEIKKPIQDYTLHEMIIYTSDFLASRLYQNKEPWMEQQLKRIASHFGTNFEYTK